MLLQSNLFLIIPYLIVNNVFLSLFVVLINALIVVLFFTYYISVAKNLSFKKRFLEMAGLSLSVAAINFFIGWGIRQIFGIDVQIEKIIVKVVPSPFLEETVIFPLCIETRLQKGIICPSIKHMLSSSASAGIRAFISIGATLIRSNCPRYWFNVEL